MLGGHICWGTYMYVGGHMLGGAHMLGGEAHMHICTYVGGTYFGGHVSWGVRILGGMYSVCMGRCDVKRHKYLTVSRCYTLR